MRKHLLIATVAFAALMAGIDSNWQGAFVGAFIILAVLLGMQTGGKSLIGNIIDRLKPARRL